MPLANPYVQRIPADIKPLTAGLELDIPVGDTFTPYTITAAAQAIRLSLKTTDTRERKARALKVSSFLDTVWNALRRKELIPQSPRNCVALAREMYLAWGGGEKERTYAIDIDMSTKSVTTMDTPNDWGPELWDASIELAEKMLVDLEESPGVLDTITARLLLRVRGIMGTDSDTKAILNREFLRAMRDGLAKRKREAEGDYTPDPKAERFPKTFEEPQQQVRAPRPASGIRITGLADDWWLEASKTGRSMATYDSYKTTLKHLAAHLGHDDAARVTPSDIVGFKDARLKAGLSASTVGLNLAGIKAIFEWAKSNLKVPTNPARDVKVAKMKVTKLREKDFTTEEATAVLQHANTAVGTTRNMLAKYWVPWLCAYTGARVGEMVQLRKVDVMQDEETAAWVLCISPEAGTVKNKDVRYVVIHEHLIARGFLQMVEACEGAHLFIPNTNKLREAIKTVKGMLVAFVREVIKDPNVAPNHGWRHSFKTRGRGAGISDSVLDAICGHAPVTEGGRYGSVPLSTQVKAMTIYPRYTVEGSHQAPLNAQLNEPART